MSQKNYNDNYLPIDEIIRRAKARGVSFGKGNPVHRLRYLTKVGLFPHATRRTLDAVFSKALTAAGTVAHYPDHTVDRLVHLESQLKSGRTVADLIKDPPPPPNPLFPNPLNQKRQGQPDFVTDSATEKTLLATFMPKLWPDNLAVEGETSVNKNLSVRTRDNILVKLLNSKKLGVSLLFALVLVACASIIFSFAPARNLASQTLAVLNQTPLKNLLPQINDTLNQPIGEPVAAETRLSTSAVLATSASLDTLQIQAITTFIGPVTLTDELSALDGIVTNGANADLGQGQLTASNVLYGLVAGENITITDGQTPTISATGGVTSLNGSTGPLTLVGSGDITVSGLTVSDTSTLQSVTTRGATTTNQLTLSGGLVLTCSSCLTDTNVADNLTINSSGNVSGTAITSGVVGASVGGTGITSYTAGDLLYATGATTLTKLGIGSSNEVLTVIGGVPSWEVNASASVAPNSIDFTEIKSSMVLDANTVISSSSFTLSFRGPNSYLFDSASTSTLTVTNPIVCTDCVTATNLASTTVTPGTYGDSASYTTFTVDSDGRLTSAGTIAISGLTGSAISADSLDFTEFKDSLTLDSNTVLNNSSFTLSFRGAQNYVFDSASISTLTLSNQLIGTGVINSTNILNGTIVAADISSDTLDFTQLADSLILDSNTVISNSDFTLSFRGAQNYVFDSASIATLAITNNLIGTNVIDSTNIDDESITSTDILNGAILAVDISADSLNFTQLADSLTLDANTVISNSDFTLSFRGTQNFVFDSASIATLTLTNNIIGTGVVDSTNIDDGGILAVDISVDSLDFAQFQDSLDLDANTVLTTGGSTLTFRGAEAVVFDSANVSTLTLTNVLNGTGVITSTNILDGTILAADISSDTLNFTSLADSLTLDANTVISNSDFTLSFRGAQNYVFDSSSISTLTVTNNLIGTGIVDSTNIDDGGILAADISADSLNFTQLADSLTLDANTVISTSDFTLSFRGANSVLFDSATISTLTLTNDLVCTDCITATNLEPDSVGSSELAATSVVAGTYGDTARIATFTVDGDGRLTAAGSLAITGASISADSLNFTEFSDSLVLDANTVISNSSFTLSFRGAQNYVFDSASIATLTLTNNLIGTNVIDSTNIDDESITSTDILNGSILAVDVSADSLDFTQLSDSLTLDSNTVLSNSSFTLSFRGAQNYVFDSASIATLAITNNLIGTNVIDSTNIDDESITSTDILNGAILAVDISSDSLNFTQLADSLTLDANTVISSSDFTLTFRGANSVVFDSANVSTLTLTNVLNGTGVINSTNILNGTILGADLSADTLDFTALADTLALDAHQVIDSSSFTLSFRGANSVVFDSASIATLTLTNVLNGTGVINSTNILNGTLLAADISSDTLDFTSLADSLTLDNNTVISSSDFTLSFRGAQNYLFDSASVSTLTITNDLIGTDVINSGNIEANAVGSSELAATTVTGGTYGDSSNYAVFTVDGDGRLTAAGTIPVTTAADSLDFIHFEDSLELDANTVISNSSFTLSFRGGQNYVFDSASIATLTLTNNLIGTNVIDSTNIDDESITSTDILNGSILAVDVSSDSLDFTQLADSLTLDANTVISNSSFTLSFRGAQNYVFDSSSITTLTITNNLIGTNVIDSTNIDDESVTSTDILNGSILAVDISADSLNFTQLADSLTLDANTVISSSDFTLSFRGANSVLFDSATISTLTLTNDLVCTDCITATNLEPDSVGSSELAATSVVAGTYGDTARIATFTVDGDGRLTAAGSLAITGASISADSLNFTEFSDSLVLDANTVISSSDFTLSFRGAQNYVFDSASIATLTLTNNLIGTNVIDSTNIDDGSITSTDILDGTILAADISSDALNFTQLADSLTLDANTVISNSDFTLSFRGAQNYVFDSSSITTLAITNNLIGTNVIDSTNIDDESITSTDILNGSILAVDISADSLNFTQLGDSLTLDANTVISNSDFTLSFRGAQNYVFDSASIATLTLTNNLIGTDVINSTNIDDGGILAVDISVDSLDFDRLQDSLDLDANTVVTTGGSTLTFRGAEAVVFDSANISTLTLTNVLNGTGVINTTNILDGTILAADISADALNFTSLADSLTLDANTVISNSDFTLSFRGAQNYVFDSASIATLTLTNNIIGTGVVDSTNIDDGGILAVDISADSLNFTQLADSLTLDANTVIDSSSFTLTFRGNTVVFDSANISTLTLTNTINCTGCVTSTNILDGTILAADISVDSLDFAQFEDSLDLDASTVISAGSNTLSFRGAQNYQFDSALIGTLTVTNNLIGTGIVDSTNIDDGGVLAVDISVDSLDFDQFQDSLDLDSATVLTQGTNTFFNTFSGTTGPAWTFNSTGAVTSGVAGVDINVSSNSTTTDAVKISNSGTGDALQIDQRSGSTGFALNVNGKNSIFNSAQDGSTGGWSTNAYTIPDTARGQHSSVTANGYVYVIGGYDGSNAKSTVYYAKLNSDGSTGSWSSNVFTLPINRVRHSSVVANGYVYVIGGDNGGTYQSTVYYAKLNSDGSTGSWSTNAHSLPALRGSHTSVVANGYVYVIGGYNGTTYQSTVYYAKLNNDGSTGSWSTNTFTIPGTGRASHTSVVANGYVYVIGGSNGDYQSTVYYARLNSDGSTGSWSTNVYTLPNRLSDHTSVISNGYVYVIGGQNQSSVQQSTVYYAKLNSDGGTGSWSTNVYTLPGSGRAFHSSVYSNGYVYVLGGWNGTDYQSTVYYTSTARIQVAGSLDLLGQTQTGGLGDSPGGVGGSIYAGNIFSAGTLEVTGNTQLWGGLNVVGGIRSDTAAAGTLQLVGFNCSVEDNGGLLTTDSSGYLVCGDDDTSGGVGADSLDFVQFEDTLNLDANTIIDSSSFTLTFRGGNSIVFDSASIATLTLTNNIIGTGVVDSTNIDDGGILAVDISVDSLDFAQFQDSLDLDANTVLTTGGSTLTFRGAEAVVFDSANVSTLTLTNVLNGTGVITSTNILDGTILAADISADTLNFTSLADSLTLDANTVISSSDFTLSFRGANAVVFDSANISTLTLTNVLNGTGVINSTNILDGTILAADISSDTLNFTSLADSLTLDANTVISNSDFTLSFRGAQNYVFDSASIATLTITNNLIGTNVIDSTNIDDGSITSTDILDGTILAADISIDSLDFAQFQDSLDLDANTVVTTGGSTLTFRGAEAVVFDSANIATLTLTNVLNGTGVINSTNILDGTILAADISVDSLDFAQFEDSLDLDASTVISAGSNTLSFRGAQNYQFDSALISTLTVTNPIVGTGIVNSTNILDGSVLAVDISVDSLDFDQFQDSLDLDSATVLTQGTNTFFNTFSGTTGPAWTFNSTGAVTSGVAGVDINVSSNSTTTDAVKISNSGTGDALQIDQRSTSEGFALNVNGRNSIFNSAQDGEISNWSTNTYTLPGLTTYATSVVANGYVYVIGGLGSGSVHHSTVYYAKLQSDGSTGAWSTSVYTIPGIARGEHTSVVANGYVYIIGGSHNSTNYLTSVYYAKLNSDGSTSAWSLSPNTLPASRGYATSVVANGYVYEIGGFDGSNATSTVYYAKLNSDGSTGSWNTNVNTLPEARYIHSSVVANGYVYVIGGFDGTSRKSSVYYARLNSDGSTGSWSTSTQTLPALKQGATSVVANGHLYVMGGGTSTPSTSVYYAKLNSDGSTSSWSSSPYTLPASRFNASSVVANGYVYEIGGYISGSTATSTVYYSSLARVSVAGTLDLVGQTSGNLADYSSTGGEIYAGNIFSVGSLDIKGNSNFWNGLSVNGGLTIRGSSAGDYGSLFLDGKGSTGNPSTCGAGSVYFNTTDSTFQGCTASNTWTRLDNSVITGSQISVDSLDFAQLEDSLDLDANTVVTTGGNTLTFRGAEAIVFDSANVSTLTLTNVLNGTGVINSTNILDGTILAVDISADSLNFTQLADSLTLDANTVISNSDFTLSFRGAQNYVFDSSSITTLTITNNLIGTNVIDSTNIDDESVTSTDILNGSILAVDISVDSLNFTQLADSLALDANTVISNSDFTLSFRGAQNYVFDSASIATLTITNNLIGTNVIDSTNIDDGSITSTDILDGTILAADISIDSLDFAQLQDSLDLDAHTVLTTGGSTLTFRGAEAVVFDSANIATLTLTNILNGTGVINSTNILDGTILAADLSVDSLDFTLFEDSLDLDASTVISNGGNTLAFRGSANYVFDSANIATLTLTNPLVGTGVINSTNLLDGTILAADLSVDSLDFAQFEDSMDLDASTVITTGSNALSIRGSGGLIADSATLSILTVSNELNLTPKTSSTTTTEGAIYYDSDDDQVKVYANGKWQADRSTATLIVAAFDSQNKEKADYVSDGTDDDVTIEAAITALPSTGGVVVLLDGTYDIGDAAGDGVDITKSNVTLTGAGRSTILRRQGNAAATDGVIMVGDGGTTTVSGIVISNLAIDGVKATYSSTNNRGIDFNQDTTHSRIDRVWVFDNGADGINLHGSSGDLVSNNTITNSQISSNTGDGLELGATYTTNIIVSNNTISSNTGDGINLDSNYTSITGNQITSNGGIGIAMSSGTTYSTITGNNVAQNTGDGIFAMDTNHTISGNILYLNGGDGLDSTSLTNSVISNNTIAPDSGSTDNGIRIDGGTLNNISGNSIKSAGQHGIFLNTSSGSNSVVGNVINEVGGSDDGIMISGSDNNIITGNRISDTSGSQYGINVSTASSDNNYISQNEISGAGFSAETNDSGTGTTIQHRDWFEIESAFTTQDVATITGSSLTTGDALQINGSSISSGFALNVNGKNSIFNSAQDGSTGSWSTSVYTLPQRLNEHTSVVANGYVYVIGGQSTAAQSTIYYAKLNSDGSTGAWTSNVSTLPEARYLHTSVVANGYIYVIGGASTSADVSTVYYAKLNSDGSTGSWSSNAQTLPRLLNSHSSVVANGYVYVMGGCNSTCSSGTTRFSNVYYAKLNSDGSTGAWSNNTFTLPTARINQSSVVANGYIYVIGGSNLSNPQSTIYYARLNSDGSTGSWSTNTFTLPQIVDDHSSVVANGYLYMLGGDNNSVKQSLIYYARLNSDGSIGSWSTSNYTLPSVSNTQASVVSNGYIYVIGGSDSSTSLSTVYYAPLARVSIAGDLDLLGQTSGFISDANGSGGSGTTGGSIYAGNIFSNGTLEVTGNSQFWNGLAVNGGLTINGSSASDYGSLFLQGKGTTGNPTTCGAGSVYFNTTDSTFQGCTSSNTWARLDNVAGSVDDDSLDFIKFEDTLNLDANTIIDSSSFTLTFRGGNAIVFDSANVSTLTLTNVLNGTGVITSTNILDGTILAADISADALDFAALADSLSLDNSTVISNGSNTLSFRGAQNYVFDSASIATLTVTNPIVGTGIVNSTNILDGTILATDISVDSLDFAQFEDSLDLDASTVISAGSNTLSFRGAQNYQFDSALIGTLTVTNNLIGTGIVDSTNIDDGGVLAIDISVDSLDYDQFQDSLDLDAATVLTQGTNAFFSTFSGTTGPAQTFNSTGIVTSGDAAGLDINVTSASTTVDAFQISNSGTGDALQLDQRSTSTGFALNVNGRNSIFNSAQDGSTGGWSTSVYTIPDTARGGHSSVTANGYVYVIGGYNGSAYTSTVYYAKLNSDGSTEAWASNTYTLPQILSSHTSVVANGYVYVIGGRNATVRSTVYYARLNSDGSTGAWSTNTYTLPEILANHTSVVANGYVYVIAGYDGNFRKSTVYYARLNADGSTGAWSSNTYTLPALRNQHSSVVANGYVYVIGGLSADGSVIQSTVYYARLNSDGSTGSWNTNTYTLPQALRQHSSIVIKGYLYVIGGGSNGAVTQSTVYYARLNSDGSTGSWNSNIYTLPVRRDQHSSIVANGYVYILGGSDSAYRSTVYYASLARVSIAGDLDLLGQTSANLTDANGNSGQGSTGGSIYAGNIFSNGTLEVTGNSNFWSGLSVNGGLTLRGSSAADYGQLFLQPKATTGNPAACGIGTIYVNSADASVLACTAANTWEALDGGGAPAADSLDFIEFKDTLTLDAHQIIDSSSFTLTFRGNSVVFDSSSIATLTLTNVLNGTGVINSTNILNDTIVSADVSADTLDFLDFEESLDLDASTVITTGGNTLAFRGAETIVFDSATIATLTVTNPLVGTGIVNSTNILDATILAADISIDSLDFAQFQDSLDLDAHTVLTTGGSTLTFRGAEAVVFDSANISTLTLTNTINCTGCVTSTNILDGTILAADISVDSLDFAQFQDSLDLDAHTVLTTGGSTLTFRGAEAIVFDSANIATLTLTNVLNGTGVVNTTNILDGTILPADISVDSLDFAQFEDSLDLDAHTVISVGANTLSFRGAQGIVFDSAVITKLTVTDCTGCSGGAIADDSLDFNKFEDTLDLDANLTLNLDLFDAEVVNNFGRSFQFDTNGSTGGWTSSVYTLPTRLQSQGAVSANGYLYVVAGRIGNDESSNIYYSKINSNGSINGWSTNVYTLPGLRTDHTSVVNNGYLYAIGGNSGGTGYQSTVYYAKLNSDGSTGSWSSSAFTLPQRLLEHTSVVANGYLYILGGANSVTQSTVYYSKLNSDGTNSNWTTSPQTLPQLLKEHSTVVANGYIYVIGGTDTTAQSTVYYSRLASDGSLGTWTTNAYSLPQISQTQAAVVANGYLYVIGGGDGTTSTSTVYYAKLNSNGSTNSWASNTFTHPGLTSEHSVLVVNGYMYSLGGTYSGTTESFVYYSSLARVQVAGTLDLIGLTSGGLTEGGDTGGQIYAGDIFSNSNLEVSGTSQFNGGMTSLGSSNFILDSGETVSTSTDGSHGAWTASPYTLPNIARASATSVVANGYAYVIGGVNQTSHISTVYYTKLNPDGTTGAWNSNVYTLPAARSSTASLVANGYLYVLGGFDGSAYTSNIYYAKLNYDGSTQAWSTNPYSIPNVSLGLHTTVTANGYIYILGGQDPASATSRVYFAKLNSNGTTSNWIASAYTLPGTGRHSHTSFTHNGYVYVVGGVGANPANASSTIYYSKLNGSGELSAWISNAYTLPTVLTSAHSSVVSNGYLYVLGGSNGSEGTSRVYYARLNPNGGTGSWSYNNYTLPAIRLDHTSLSANGYIYVFGGRPGSTTYQSTVYYAPIARANYATDVDLDGAGLFGAGLRDCKGADSRLQYTEDTGQFSCLDSNNTHGAGVVRILKAATEVITGTFTTLQNDDQLTWSVGTNETWIVNANLIAATHSTADFKFQWSAPASSTCTLRGNFLGSGIGSVQTSACASPLIVDRTNTGSVVLKSDALYLNGTIVTAGTAGTVTLQWAQNAARSDSTYVAAGSTLLAFKVEGADLAEAYYTTDPDIRPGNVVSIDKSLPAGVKKSAGAYDPDVLGIVSTEPGLMIGDGTGAGQGAPVFVGLKGRVPVDVSNENGEIKAGDYLTSSTIPGVAMKATKATKIVGRALNDQNSTDPETGIGKAVAFIEDGYFNGERLEDQVGALRDENGDVRSDLTQREISTTILDHFVSGIADVDQTNLSEVITDRLAAGLEIITPTLVSERAIIDTIESKNEDLKITLGENGEVQILGDDDKPAIRFDKDGNAFFAGTITVDKIQANQIEGLEILAGNLEALNARFDYLTASPSTIATYSGETATQSASTSSATTNISGLDYLEAVDIQADTATFTGTLKSFGDSYLSNLNLTGVFSQDGTLMIQNGNELSVIGYQSLGEYIGGTLYLQKSPLSSGLDILGGKVKIDRDGNLVALGDIKSRSIEAEELRISTQRTATSSAGNLKDPTIGSATLPQGSYQIFVPNNSITEDSKIFITPTTLTPQPLFVTSKENEVGFTVEVYYNSEEDISFDYWIVN